MRSNGATQYRFYVAGNPNGRVILVMYTTNSLELFGRYQQAFVDFTESIKFEGVQAAVPQTNSPQNQPSGSATQPGQAQPNQPGQAQPNQPGQAQPNQPSQPTSSTLPRIQSPTYADLIRLKIDPERQPIPDEFRCYGFQDSDDYSKPDFALQILPNNQYRTSLGNGSYSLRTSSSRLNYVVWRSGPLEGSDDAFVLFKNYGQELHLDEVGREEREFYCYQQGMREQVAQLEFRFKDPQVGRYPCTQRNGGASAGTLEILSGRRYRLGSSEGRYKVNILGNQDEDWGRVEFIGGSLNEQSAFYAEEQSGERSFSVYANTRFECKVVVAPTKFPQFGSAKAPPPPAGSGGLEGIFAGWRIDPLATTTPTCGGLCWDLYFFNKNGYVYTDEPDESLEGADCSRTKPNGYPVCEVYRIQGNQITIGNQKPVTFQRTSQGLKLDGDDLQRLEKVDGLKLQGTFRAFSGFVSTTGGSGGGFSEVELSFSPDGRFTRDAAGGFSFTGTDTGTPSGNTTSGVTTTSQRSNSGTYRFVANTLELKYGDGRVVRLFAFVGGRDKQGKPNLLRIGGRDYSLKDK